MSNPLLVRIWVPEHDSDPALLGSIPTIEVLIAFLKSLEHCSLAYVISDEELQRIADGNAERAYRETVTGFVDDLKRAVRDGEIDDRDGAIEYLEQSIDGCQDVIYTARAQEVLRHSRNDDAYFNDFGSEGAITRDGIEWSKLAYCALLADVQEELGDLDEWFTCSECNGDTTAEDRKLAGDDLPVCEDCRAEPEPEDEPADQDEDEDKPAEGGKE